MCVSEVEKESGKLSISSPQAAATREMAQQQQQQQNQVLKTGQFYNFSDTEPKYISPKSAFLGCCRSVDEFQKLNRIGEGTYGIV